MTYRHSFCVAAALVLVVCLIDGLPAEDARDWSQYNYNHSGWRFNHTEHALNVDTVSSLKEKWRFPASDSDEKIGIVHGTPIVVDGFVYFGTTRSDPAFYKLTPSGKLVWKYSIESVMTLEKNDPYAIFGSENVSSGVMNSGLVTDQHVFFGTFDGQVICLDRFTGQQIWRVETKQPPFESHHPANTVMSAPVMADGKLIVAGGGFEHSLGAIEQYPCCTGRGFVAAFDPDSGKRHWVYDVGPEPETFPEPIELPAVGGGTKKFVAGPSTSSVWCTPSYDPDSMTLFFGTDTHNAPRRPTADDARLHNEYSCAVIAVDVEDGSERWVRQISPGDVWNSSLPAYDETTGRYKDLSIGDTPKLYSIVIDGHKRDVLGVGCKDGGFYVMDRDSGEILYNTPTYRGAPIAGKVASRQHRILALPSIIGGLQTGCAFDGQRIYANGIDWPGLNLALSRMDPFVPPTGGRVTAITPHTLVEHWRHERPIVDYFNAADGRKYKSGDPVASGIAVGGGVLYFTTNISGKLSAIDARTGELLTEITLGPVWCGPSISRGRVYVGSGNNLFRPWNAEVAEKSPGGFSLPLTEHGAVYSFGLPGEDEVSRIPETDSRQ